MKRILVVANRTLLEQHLLDAVRRRRQAGPVQIHVLVPATHPRGQWTDHQAEEAAEARLAEMLELLAMAGIGAAGEVGDASPVLAVQDLLRRGERFDEIIVSTLPESFSKWLAANAVKRIALAAGMPVTHVVAEPATAGAPS